MSPSIGDPNDTFSIRSTRLDQELTLGGVPRMRYILITDPDLGDEILNYSFEANRQEVVDETYGFNHNHPIVVRDDNIVVEGKPDECIVCCDIQDMRCVQCKCPLCATCVDKVRTSTGKCPHCQQYPLEVERVTFTGCDDHHDETTHVDTANDQLVDHQDEITHVDTADDTDDVITTETLYGVAAHDDTNDRI